MRTTETVHYCHAANYTCPNIGARRSVTNPSGVYETWCCDEHWRQYLGMNRERTTEGKP